IGTSEDAVALDYPLNEPVRIFSNDATALTALGVDGTLGPAVNLINAQLGEFSAAAVIVIVRVAEGLDDDATITNIVGNGTTTGIAAFLRSAAKLGVTPRLIGAPGYTSQRDGVAANAVCAALPAVLSKLLAHAVVDGPATTLQAALDWRETIASERIISVDPAVLVGSPAVTLPLSPAVLGLAVRRDSEFSGRPFHSWANQPLYGIVGPSRPIDFSLTDGATEGQTLLANNIGILMRSEMGVSSSLGNGGFIFVGTDNCGADELWRFYNVTRGRDYIHLMLLNTLRNFLGRFNITSQTVQAIINTMEQALRDLKAEGDILGYKVQFLADKNSPEDLRAGRIVVNFEAEEAPVLRHITIQSGRMRSAVDALISELASAA
ncbi:MAG: hypothetical protein RL299_1264, partial [Pseudomonadota bacterium]